MCLELIPIRVRKNYADPTRSGSTTLATSNICDPDEIFRSKDLLGFPPCWLGKGLGLGVTSAV